MRSVQLALVALAGLGAAMPGHANKEYKMTKNDVEYNVFDHANTNSSLHYVKNSGICETTPGVNQYSGYSTVGDDMNMFFWFFEARKAAKTAPLTLWLNGGPGCSSLIGLFQENGPCTFNDGSKEPKLNPHSWNNYANMLYVDQPIGAGFSYGNVYPADNTPDAAPFVWNLLQAFLTKFPEYESRDFGLFTESYGGHYGPAFAHYFQQQNDAIDAGTVKGEKLNLVALGVNNGWIEPETQYRAYIDFAANNTYRPLIDKNDAGKYYRDCDNHCPQAYEGCTQDSSSDDQCAHGDDVCSSFCERPVLTQYFDAYDIRADRDVFPPSAPMENYLGRSDIKKAIGARGRFASCGGSNISAGDSARSFAPDLVDVINSGIQVLVWAGDADWICNWMGNYEVLTKYAGDEFNSKSLQPWTLNGKEYGEFKTAGNLNWLRVYEAGHEVPAYQPEAAFAAFKTIMSKQNLKATN